MARRRTRTFLAIDGGAALHAGVESLEAEIAKVAPNVRLVSEQNRHITVLFLGEVDEKELHGLCRTVAQIAAKCQPFVVRLGGLGAFPNLRRPKILWAGVTEGSQELSELHDRLETALEDLGEFRREERGYTPHLTLGRITDDVESERIANLIPQQRLWAGGQAMVHELLVMGSEQRQDGPEYMILARAPFAPLVTQVTIQKPTTSE